MAVYINYMFYMCERKNDRPVRECKFFYHFFSPFCGGWYLLACVCVILHMYVFVTFMFVLCRPSSGVNSQKSKSISIHVTTTTKGKICILIGEKHESLFILYSSYYWFHIFFTLICLFDVFLLLLRMLKTFGMECLWHIGRKYQMLKEIG